MVVTQLYLPRNTKILSFIAIKTDLVNFEPIATLVQVVNVKIQVVQVVPFLRFQVVNVIRLVKKKQEVVLSDTVSHHKHLE